MQHRVAERWFETRAVGDGVTLIFEPHVDAGVRCNIWHLRGRDRDLLLDSGLGVRSLRAEVALVAEREPVCVASHTHFDHVGGHHEFSERLVHAAEADILATPDRERTAVADYMQESLFTAAPDAAFEPDAYAVRAAPATRELLDGDVVDLGDRVLEVLHLPGHSPGSIGLWERATGLLFSGDAVYDGELFDNLYHSDVDDYLRSMRRLRELPVTMVHGGHHGSFGRQRFQALIDGYLSRRRRPRCPATRP